MYYKETGDKATVWTGDKATVWSGDKATVSAKKGNITVGIVVKVIQSCKCHN